MDRDIKQNVAKLNSVYKNKKTGLKFIIHSGNKCNIENTIEEYNFVCDNAHEDGDYSYLCCSEYCRCKQ